MSSPFPYTLYSCPCTDINSKTNTLHPTPQPDTPESDEDEQEEQTFNPHSPRADYALYPLEHLLFCNECHELRCPRCYYEESLYYYCPSCLFETQASVVRTETNRCTRNCYQCPVCFAPLGLSGFQAPSDAEQEAPPYKEGPFILSCPHCCWTTLEIGITFEKPMQITAQLAKLPNGSTSLDSSRDAPGKEGAESTEKDDQTSDQATQSSDRFTKLAEFYKKQTVETTPAGGFGMSTALGLESPSYLTRLLSTYGAGSLRKQKGKVPLMREAHDASEGLALHSEADDDAMISRMRTLGWDATTSAAQRAEQLSYGNDAARMQSDVRPVATRLRAKRAKRCRTCRNNLVKPDEKRHSTRYRIKLVALHYIPRITLQPPDAASVPDPSALPPGKTLHFLLTLRNPLFDRVRVTLATPAVTPGRVSSAVTILCPQFELGANTDVWEEALDTGDAERRRARDVAPVEGQQPEAGKLWARGRNWTTVVLEVVPGRLDALAAGAGGRDQALGSSGKQAAREGLVEEEERPRISEKDRQVNEDVLEVPVFLRMEWETESDDISPNSRMVAAALEDAGAESKPKMKREVAFWVVLGVGRIAPSQTVRK